MRDNIQVWSLDDYQKVYYLCCGFDDKYGIEVNDYLFSDTCIIYAREFVPDHIQEHMRSEYIMYQDHHDSLLYTSGSIRLYKCMKPDMNDFWYGGSLHDDIAMHFIKTQQLHLYCDIYTFSLIHMMIYEDEYIIHKVMNDTCRYIRNILYEYYTKGEYRKGQKLYEITSMLNMNVTYYDVIMKMMNKWQYLWKDIYDKNVFGYCEKFIDGYFTKDDIPDILEILLYINKHDYDFLNRLHDVLFHENNIRKDMYDAMKINKNLIYLI
jgi:hypothetical protein